MSSASHTHCISLGQAAPTHVTPLQGNRAVFRACSQFSGLFTLLQAGTATPSLCKDWNILYSAHICNPILALGLDSIRTRPRNELGCIAEYNLIKRLILGPCQHRTSRDLIPTCPGRVVPHVRCLTVLVLLCPTVPHVTSHSCRLELRRSDNRQLGR